MIAPALPQMNLCSRIWGVGVGCTGSPFRTLDAPNGVRYGAFCKLGAIGFISRAEALADDPLKEGRAHFDQLVREVVVGIVEIGGLLA